jgi:hypothetical protein
VRVLVSDTRVDKKGLSPRSTVSALVAGEKSLEAELVIERRNLAKAQQRKGRDGGVKGERELKAPGPFALARDCMNCLLLPEPLSVCSTAYAMFLALSLCSPWPRVYLSNRLYSQTVGA